MEKRDRINNQPIQFSPERFVRPICWVIAGALRFVLWLRYEKQCKRLRFTSTRYLQLRQIDFHHKPIGFYLFLLPAYDL